MLCIKMTEKFYRRVLILLSATSVAFFYVAFWAFGRHQGASHSEFSLNMAIYFSIPAILCIVFWVSCTHKWYCRAGLCVSMMLSCYSFIMMIKELSTHEAVGGDMAFLGPWFDFYFGLIGVPIVSALALVVVLLIKNFAPESADEA
jgi:hypothetical protein